MELVRAMTVRNRRSFTRPTVDQDLIARLEAMPEAAILDYFWLMDRQGADRLLLLLQATEIRVHRQLDWDYSLVRREHERRGRSGTLHKRQCFACAIERVNLYFHHILE